MAESPIVYIAGPMRGYPAFNFAAFDEARDRAAALGYRVHSPADIDREAWGFCPLESDESLHRANDIVSAWTASDLDEVILRDIKAIMESTHIAMLRGWEDSTGAKSEYQLAVWRGIEILDAETMKPMRSESILEEALRITRGPRQSDYGHPRVEHNRIAQYWTTFLGCSVTAEQVAMMMVLLKVARQGHRNKRDSLVDIAGYADCCQRILEDCA
jgi:hypothetical protein